MWATVINNDLKPTFHSSQGYNYHAQISCKPCAWLMAGLVKHCKRSTGTARILYRTQTKQRTRCNSRWKPNKETHRAQTNLSTRPKKLSKFRQADLFISAKARLTARVHPCHLSRSTACEKVVQPRNSHHHSQLSVPVRTRIWQPTTYCMKLSRDKLISSSIICPSSAKQQLQ